MIRTKKSFQGVVLAVAITSTLSSCASSNHRDTVRMNSEASRATLERADAARLPIRQSSSFMVNDGFHAARTPLQPTSLSPRARLPEAFQRPAGITRPGSVSVGEVASHISRISNYRVNVAPDVIADGGGTFTQGVMFSQGSLEGLLDYMSTELNVSWKWTGSNIEIYRFDTKMFKVNALAGITDVATTLDTTSASSSGSGGGSTGGGGQSGNEGSSGQRTQISSNFNLWEDITESVRSLLSTGGSMTTAPSAGTITVRDTPLALQQVEAQIREFNKIYSRQVVLDVSVYAVERTAADSAATDWSVAWREAAGRYGLGFSSNNAGGTGGAQAPGFSGTIATGPFAGTGAVFQALSSIGNASLLTNGTVSSLNGQSVPLNVSNEQAYLQSYSTSLTSGDFGGSTTTLTPGVVTEGFSMHFTPRILEDNKVLMRYSIDLSSVDNIETFEAPDGNSAIQLPRRSVRNFMQNVSMRSGETLVLTGYQQSSAQDGSSGPFSARAWGAGGRRSSEKLTRTIVIVVTPRVVE